MAQVTIEQAMWRASDLHRAGRLPEAEKLCRQVLAAQPDRADAWNLLGILFHTAGRPAMAADLIGRAVAAAPTVAEYHSNLGNVLRAAGRLDEAIAAYRDALAIQPGAAAVHSNLGAALVARGDVGQGIEGYRTAIGLDPSLAEAHSNLGNALLDLGRIGDAIDAYRAAIAIVPDHAEVRCNLGMCLLLRGEFAEGWAELEWRLRCGDAGRAARHFAHPRWAGEPLAGRTILLHAEQGFGDTIHFLRYAGLVAARGGRVVVECQPELVPLLRQLPSVAEWVAHGEHLPRFDVHCPLLSLPRVFDTRLDTVPPMGPPLSADADRAAMWRGRLDAAGPRVGLCWAGNPGHANDRNRSIPLADLAPLAEALPHGRFASLQVGPAAGQALSAAWPNLLDASAELRDFTDTAALIDRLDLVITVDTAVAHLAAAMGKPTWLLLPFTPDWRWMLDRSDSPWYPSMRLFRQTSPGKWAEVVSRVAAELRALP
jgi:Flp pilus assembly protein TadD